MRCIPDLAFPIIMQVVFLIHLQAGDALFIPSEAEPTKLDDNLLFPKIQPAILSIDWNNPGQEALEGLRQLHIVRKNLYQEWLDIQSFDDKSTILHTIAPIQVGIQKEAGGRLKAFGVPRFLLGGGAGGLPGVPPITGPRRVAYGYPRIWDFRWEPATGQRPLQYEIRVAYEVMFIDKDGIKTKGNENTYYKTGLCYIPITFPGDNNYTIAIRARNELGVSDWSSGITLTCVSAP
jgi:hypothetical protein